LAAENLSRARTFELGLSDGGAKIPAVSAEEEANGFLDMLLKRSFPDGLRVNPENEPTNRAPCDHVHELAGHHQRMFLP
jgi:hypothetical protein